MPTKNKNTPSSDRHLKVRVTDKKERTASSRRWLERQLNDPYVRHAKQKGYRSRAAFKLLEIDNKFRLLSKGKRVIDLGSAPGGWSQVAVERVKGGLVIGVDIQDVDPIPGAHLIKADFTETETITQILTLFHGKVDVVLSDMAAPACGIPKVDHVRIMNLVELAFNFSKDVLEPGGSFVAKVLRGGTETYLLTQLKQAFTKVTHFKPPSSRKDSAELFVVAIGFKGII